ncbi:MAG: magnesium transporter [Candidatus Marinimicrobia bacterium]|jgi:magnesium transporter|nr:magnesium transporter [Candidatus Neomarinimicrobiota bacterium]MBT6008938.1 magnesium transporter [Rhodobacterales bacterium]MBT3937908.1 magnesium transporter [Candidatus Neomarinimicrobiota bacterium]MBT3961038.1 magnesium transporter [Candidatus Neomarinimicrobiota bacterium]MBT4383148.1 magnesium transporter [Candidatus Neomarinimicrobiota bacterium]|tara:strand:- start:114 stop:1484 length:1371 start_codon:yes stop_codon:yes gene_type:complete
MKTELFEHEITLLRDTFRRLLRRHARTNLVKLIQKTHTADLAVIFRYFSDVEQEQVFKLMQDDESTAEFLSALDESILTNILEREQSERIAMIVREAGSNDQGNILNSLSEDKTQSVLELLRRDEQEEIEEILAYPEDSAGSLMSTDVFALHQDSTSRAALKALQDQDEAEMAFYIYVTDDDERLVGVISLRTLAITHPETLLSGIMIKSVHMVRAETDQEDVAQLVAQYNYLAVPVVDGDTRLLGIVTVDDVVDVIREEATEDFLQMAGAGKDREILNKSSWDNAKARLPWLFASWLGGILAATVIGVYEDVLQSTIALAAFIPVIMGMGGNIGTQSSTIVVRGIATGRVDFGSEFKIIMKEVTVGFILGGLYGILLGLFAMFRFIDAPAYLGLVVGLSIGLSMLVAAAVGTIIPLFLRKVDIDPAIATGPFVTTSVDVVGVLLYFVIATSFLNL